MKKKMVEDKSIEIIKRACLYLLSFVFATQVELWKVITYFTLFANLQ